MIRIYLDCNVELEPLCTIQRLSDGYWFDASSGVWLANTTTNPMQSVGNKRYELFHTIDVEQGLYKVSAYNTGSLLASETHRTYDGSLIVTLIGYNQITHPECFICGFEFPKHKLLKTPQGTLVCKYCYEVS